AALIRDPELSEQKSAFVVPGRDEVASFNPHLTFQRRIKTDEVFQQRALATARATQNHEYFTLPHLKIDVLENNVLSVPNLEVAHGDDDFVCVVHRSRTKKRMEKMASAMTISTMLVTTARVVETPTALGPCCVCNPRKQPTAETIAPNTTPLAAPKAISLNCTAEVSW